MTEETKTNLILDIHTNSVPSKFNQRKTCAGDQTISNSKAPIYNSRRVLCFIISVSHQKKQLQKPQPLYIWHSSSSTLPLWCFPVNTLRLIVSFIFSLAVTSRQAVPPPVFTQSLPPYFCQAYWEQAHPPYLSIPLLFPALASLGLRFPAPCSIWGV